MEIELSNVPGITVEPIELDRPDPFVAPLTSLQLTEQAAKAHWALGSDSPGEPVIQHAMANGLEGELRNREAIKEAIRVDEKKRELAKQYTQSVIQSGRKLDPRDLEFIKSMTAADLQDPNTFFERKFSKTLMERTLNDAAKNGNFFVDNKAQQEIDVIGSAFQERVAKQEVVKKLYEQVMNQRANQSWGASAADFGGALVPFITQLDLVNAMKDAPTTTWFLGSNVAEQIQHYYNLPVEEAARRLEGAVREISEKNLYNAKTYLEMFLKMGSSEQLAGNLMTIADITTVPGLTIAKTLQGVARTTNMYRNLRVPTMLEAQGDIPAAGARMAFEEATAKMAGTPKGETFKAIIDDAQPIFNPGYLTENGTAHSQGWKARLQDLLETTAEKLFDAGVVRPITIDRLVPGTEAYEAAIADATKLFNKLYPEVNDSILAVRPVVGSNTLANTDHVAIDLGTKGSTYIQNEAAAKLLAEEFYGLKPSQYTIMQNGNGWFIRMTKALDETAPSVRNMLQVETKNATPRGFINTFMGFLRSNEDRLPKVIVDDLKVATYGSSGLTKILRDVSKEIGAVKDTDTFMGFVAKQRDFIDPKTKDRGRFSKDLGEFERDWVAYTKGRAPTEQEARAYFTYVQMNNIDWVLRNMSIYRDKSRLGLELYHFEYPGVTAKSPQIEGKMLGGVKDIYANKESANVLIWDHTGNTFKNAQRDFIARKTLEEYEEKGYKVFQLSEFGEKTLRAMPLIGDKMPDSRITFVMAKDVQSAPLHYKQIPNKPGGHVDYMDGFFVSQPEVHFSKNRNVTLSHYYGDKNAFHFTSQKQAEKFTERMEIGRKMLVEGKEAELANWLPANLPFTVKGFKEQFKQYDKKNGIFDRDTPFYTRANGQSVEDAHKISQKYQNFTNVKDSPYNLYHQSVNMQFAGKRGQQLYTIEETGSAGNPAFKFRPAALIDPIGTLDRAADRMMRGRYLDDLKIKTAERFVAEFGETLDMSLVQARRDPFSALVEGKFNSSYQDAEKIAIAKNYRRAALEFLGLKNDFDKAVDQVFQRTADALGKSGTLVDSWTFGQLRDPIKFFRNIAFHKTMGLFNPVSFFTQVNTMTHITSLAGPSIGVHSSLSSTLTWAALKNPAMLKHLDAKISSFGIPGMEHLWKPGQFTESFDALQRSGFWNVGGEYSMVDQFFAPKMIVGGVERALDAGTVFFREGELLTRLAAWNASYLEFRKANPTRKLKDSDIRAMIARADLMTVNMSRASNASFQHGIWSVPSQFLSYPIRLAEQMLGKRLTRDEKARAFLTYGLAYGIPVTAGISTGIIPVYESFRTKLLEKGVDYDDNGLKKLFMDGLPSMILEGITGTKYDLGARFGPGGSPILKNLMDGKYLETLFGASGSAVKDGYKSILPFYYWAMSSMNPSDTETFPITMQDLLDVASTASSGNQLRIFWNGVFGGEYITRNNMEVSSKITPAQGMLMAISGTKPQEIADMWSQYGSNRTLQQHKREAEKQAIKFWRLGIDASGDGKDAQAIKYFTRAKAHLIMGGFRPDEYGEVLGKAWNGYQDAIDTINYDFLNRDPKRIEAWEAKAKRKEAR
jgi:hypothetical protein